MRMREGPLETSLVYADIRVNTLCIFTYLRILIRNVNLFSRSGLVMGLGNGFGALAGIFIPLTKDWIVGSPATCDEMVRR